MGLNRQTDLKLKNLGLSEPKCTETDLKKSQICPIWNNANLPEFGTNSDTPEVYVEW